ncbi:DgyrCDS2400 [Dimorphilus gyrociliatus]|uniref:DgyrCDS2400 n=1 Tax=Dimorphilus gyrociliatus TaxID=2664684 RepID=A0A7I8VCZ2_9ANNE|nr:DgyrCDS2400 [Dimorphilus gyrociliatus]
MPEILRTFTNSLSKVREFNSGDHCGANGVSCNAVDLCPAFDGVVGVVMNVNAGQNCEDGNKNIDSIVMKVTFNEVSVLLTGDFEDETTSASEQGT